MTDFETICKILSEMHIAYTEEDDYVEFVEFNDLGVPLAYFINEGLATASKEGKEKVLETWELLMKVGNKKDTGFTELAEVLD